jgi:hypothetical protein
MGPYPDCLYTGRRLSLGCFVDSNPVATNWQKGVPMKNFVTVLAVTGLVATWVGCESATEPGGVGAEASSEPGVTFVKLKVPNMF